MELLKHDQLEEGIAVLRSILGAANNPEADALNRDLIAIALRKLGLQQEAADMRAKN